MSDVGLLDRVLFALTLLTALGCGLVAGVFFAFSTFVMKALSRLPGSEGIAAMQAINVDVLNSWFIALFFGTAAACVLAAIFSVVQWHRPGAACLLVGSWLYLLGTVLVTVLFNVPRNKSLAAVASSDPDASERWTDYVAGWTIWNHVRTVAALGAAAAFSVALS